VARWAGVASMFPHIRAAGERGRRYESEGARDRGAPPRGRCCRRRADPTPSLGARQALRRPACSESGSHRRSRTGNPQGAASGLSSARKLTAGPRGCAPRRACHAGPACGAGALDAERRSNSCSPTAESSASAAEAKAASATAAEAAASPEASAAAEATPAAEAAAATPPDDSAATAATADRHAAGQRLWRPKPPPHRTSGTRPSGTRARTRVIRLTHWNDPRRIAGRSEALGVSRAAACQLLAPTTWWRS